jgi:hypothetical protein
MPLPEPSTSNKLRYVGVAGSNGTIRCSVLRRRHVFPAAILRSLVTNATGRADTAAQKRTGEILVFAKWCCTSHSQGPPSGVSPGAHL